MAVRAPRSHPESVNELVLFTLCSTIIYKFCVVHKQLVVVYKMVLHVKDDEADWVVRELARRRGIGITEAIREAAREALQRDESDAEAFSKRLEPIIAEVRKRKRFSFHETQAFIDEMWD